MDEKAEAVSHGIFNCRVPYSVKNHGSIETNVAIETVDGKYGLIWTELYYPDLYCKLLDYRFVFQSSIRITIYNSRKQGGSLFSFPALCHLENKL